ncbi:ATP-binding protein [Salinicoccus sp. Marseille-QA3877]
MKNRILNMSIKNRIISIFLITSITLVTMLIVAFIYIEIDNTYDRYEQLSRQTADGFSHMPDLNNAINDNDIDEIEGIIERVRINTEYPNVTIVNRDEVYIYHYNQENIGHPAETTDYSPSLLFGANITDNASGEEGSEIRTVAPIFEEVNDGERVLGAVTVSYLSSDIVASILDKVLRLALVATIGIVISVLGALWLQRSIQSDTLGYEPVTVARMFKERDAIISTVREGIIMVDKNFEITFSNPSADSVLQDTDSQKIIELFSFNKVITKGTSYYDKEVRLNGNTYIINCLPIHEDDDIVAAICSFRDKTDIKQLQDSLQQIMGYSDELRAQSHEFKNKMHVLYGLLKVEKYDEAINFIDEEKIKDESTIPTLTSIKDSGTHAILLGKIEKGREKGVEINIDPNSQLGRTDISVSDMATMLGNLIDNAIDAVSEKEEKLINIFITDIGNDIIIDVEDNGKGMSYEDSQNILSSGSSSKGENRGFGLSNVNLTVRKYNGFVTFNTEEGNGSVFSIYIPKERS